MYCKNSFSSPSVFSAAVPFFSFNSPSSVEQSEQSEQSKTADKNTAHFFCG
ncbi:hypothetical protein [Treponema pedis]|uniref:hypothetical protein n=1 Tax=Treponema pedis TaxID=409322 RepID=UPI003139BB5A